MVISFDLDDTLICHQAFVPQEQNHAPWWLRFWLSETLRSGAIDFIKALQADGHTIGVYTTSYRSHCYIKALFKCAGIRLAFVINQHDHEQRFASRLNRVASKMPHNFGIDLHIDDDTTLAKNAETFGFQIVQIDPNDLHYQHKISQRLSELLG